VADMIETNRLVVRPFEEADTQAAFEWFGDPVVMRFVPGGHDLSVEQTETRIANYRTHQAAHGFSKWVIVERASLRPIGDSGLLVLDEYGWIDLGFRLERSSWGLGFATEAAAAWVRRAFENLQLARVGAFTHPENGASIRVLEKVGFRSQRRATVMGMDAIVFVLEAPGTRTRS
jgi:[ribosomal protein S5]-alanine N-acetyltransferase